MAKQLVGVVVSDKPDKTIVVLITRRKKHPLYHKNYTVSRKISAHDEKNEAKIGDEVTIVECRPLSATKRFKLEKITERAALTKESLAAVETGDTGHRDSKSKVEKLEEKPE